MKHRTRDRERVIPTAPNNGQPGCNGKRQYMTYTTAAMFADHLRKNVDGEHAQPYRCKHCQRWHIGGNGFEKARRRT
jgi:hypothetical protein